MLLQVDSTQKWQNCASQEPQEGLVVILSAVGFEPTRSKTLRPERNPLDHSGKLTH